MRTEEKEGPIEEPPSYKLVKLIISFNKNLITLK